MDPAMDQDIDMQQDKIEVPDQHLVEIFHQSMNISSGNYRAIKPIHETQPSRSNPHLQQTQRPNQPLQPQIKYNPSQHYYHHSLQPLPAAPAPAPTPFLHPLHPPQSDTATRLLIASGIAPSSLLRSQLTLFESADDEQRRRLIQLWQIVPPGFAREGGWDGVESSGVDAIGKVRADEERLRLSMGLGGGGMHLAQAKDGTWSMKLGREGMAKEGLAPEMVRGVVLPQEVVHNGTDEDEEML